LKAAKARGTKLGPPIAAKTAAKARAARSAYAVAAGANTRAVIADIQRSGVTTLAAIGSALEARGVRTPAGCNTWHPAQVMRMTVTRPPIKAATQ
jgi:hypothetical protein